MTTEPSSSESRSLDSTGQNDATIWCQRFLGWNPVSPASPHVDVLRHLTERDYSLTRDETDAALFLLSPDCLELTDCVRGQLAERGKSTRLKDHVRRLAEDFFDLEFAERKTKLNQLKNLCSDEPALLEWLDKLASGLDVECPPMQGDQAFDRLVSACIKIFVSAPREASRIRQEFIHASREQPEFWGNAAIKLHLNHNQFTLRVAPWTRKLADWQQVERRYQQTIENLNRSVCRDSEEERELYSQHTEVEEVRSKSVGGTGHDENWVENILSTIAVIVIFSVGTEIWKARTATTPAHTPFTQQKTMPRPSGPSSPVSESKSKVDEESTQPVQPVNPEYAAQLKDLLRMSPEERNAAFRRDPRLKVEYLRLMKEVSGLISKQKSDSAGKSDRSESNDR